MSSIAIFWPCEAEKSHFHAPFDKTVVSVGEELSMLIDPGLTDWYAKKDLKWLSSMQEKVSLAKAIAVV